MSKAILVPSHLMRSRIVTSINCFLLIVLASTLISLFSTWSVNAKPVTGFNAGNIIDDLVFTNKNTMSVDQIQSFLNSKVPVCDNWGTNGTTPTSRRDYVLSRGYTLPMTCLKDYSENGLSAAQIIFNAAQNNNINPQVLIVLLQKEQGLVTDDWPIDNQYRSATGYGCPDNSPCDSKYYGLTNQINWSAHMFKSIMNSSPTWYTPYVLGNNYIQYNPNASCGGSTVYIRNKATQALYNYTPYQPNQATLDAGWDQATCGAYGNRNFYLYFTNWFGTVYSKPLWRTAESPDLFYIDSGFKYRVPSMDIISQYNLAGDRVSYVPKSQLDSVPLAPLETYSQEIGFIIKIDTDDAIYLVSGGKKIPISTMDQFTNFGFISSDIKTLPESIVAMLPTVSQPLSSFVQSPDMSVYKIDNAKKQVVFSLDQVSPSYTSALSDITLSRWTYKEPVYSRDYVVKGPDSSIRLYTNSGFHKVMNMDIYSCWGLDKIPNYKVSSYNIVPSAEKQNLSSCLASKDESVALLNKSERILISDTTGLTPITTTSTIPTSLPLSTIKPVVKSSLSDELSVIENNIRRPIMSMSIYQNLGYKDGDIHTLAPGSYNSFALGAKKLSLGSILLEPDGSISIVNSTNSRIQVRSINQFNDFGFKWASMIRVSDKDLLAYPSQGDLNYYIKSNNNAFLIDKKIRYIISPSLYNHFGINSELLQEIDSSTLDKNTIPWNISKFIKSINSSAIYYVESGQKRPIVSWDVFIRESSNRPQDIVIMSDEAVNRIPTGQDFY